MIKLAGTLSITRPTTSGDDMIEISLKDNDSRLRPVIISISPHELSMALTNLSERPCVFEFNDSGLIGKVREHKTEKVYCPNEFRLDDAMVAACLAHHEVDGWQGRRYDMGNHYNRGQDENGTYQTVVFERWVEKETTP